MPPPKSITVSAGWNLRLAFLKGSETRWTRWTTSIDSSRNGSILVVSPTRPMTVSLEPRLTWAVRPLPSIHETILETASSEAFLRKMAIMCRSFPMLVPEGSRLATRHALVPNVGVYPTGRGGPPCANKGNKRDKYRICGRIPPASTVMPRSTRHTPLSISAGPCVRFARGGKSSGAPDASSGAPHESERFKFTRRDAAPLGIMLAVARH